MKRRDDITLSFPLPAQEAAICLAAASRKSPRGTLRRSPAFLRRYHPRGASAKFHRGQQRPGRTFSSVKYHGRAPSVTSPPEIVLRMMPDIAASHSNLVTEGMLRARLIEPCRWLQLQQLFIIRRGRHRARETGETFICFVRQYKGLTIRNYSVVECHIRSCVSKD